MPTQTGRVIRLAFAWLSAAIVLLAIAAVSHPGRVLAQTTNTSSWTGTWDTDFGTMRLTQSGARVTGTYDSNAGKLTGTAGGSGLKGTWSEQPSYTAPDDAGDFEFTLAADGQSFSGRWRYGSTGDWDIWTGTRTGGGSSSAGASQPAPAAQGCNWTGTWSVHGQTATLSQSGTQVTGDDGMGDQMTGTVSGSQLNGRWTSGGNNGPIVLTMSSSCNSFTGTLSTDAFVLDPAFNGTRVSGAGS